MADNWQPEATAPIWKTVRVYPTVFRRNSQHKMHTAIKLKDGRWWTGSGKDMMKNAPTLWQHLPEGPKQ